MYSNENSVELVIENNIKEFFDNLKGAFGIKIDEIAIHPRIRHSSSNNEIVGTCFDFNVRL